MTGLSIDGLECIPFAYRLTSPAQPLQAKPDQLSVRSYELEYRKSSTSRLAPLHTTMELRFIICHHEIYPLLPSLLCLKKQVGYVPVSSYNNQQPWKVWQVGRFVTQAHTATNQFSSAERAGRPCAGLLILGVPPFLPSASFFLVLRSKRIESTGSTPIHPLYYYRPTFSTRNSTHFLLLLESRHLSQPSGEPSQAASII